jgi:hypothetical protein
VATFVKINDWARNACTTANLATDQFVIALSNTAPASQGTPPTGDGAGVLANVTQISYTNLSSRNLTTTSFNSVAGVARLILADLTLTATGGSVGPFRYVYLFDDTPTSPADPLVGYWDHGSAVTIPNGGSYLIDSDQTLGIWAHTVS